MIIIFGFIFSINNYIGNVEKTINADGIGYFDYLPSIFFHNDFIRKNENQVENIKLYERINHTGVYVDYGNFKVNKYPCGTAVLQLPFFTFACLTTELEGIEYDGYQKSFQKIVFYAAIFYLFISLFILKRILLLFQIKSSTILFCQLFLVFATSLTHYTNADAGFSHVYSVFAVSFFVYLTKLFFVKENIKYFILACVSLGLIFILRNPNILIVFFIPFIAGSKQSLVSGFKLLISNKPKLIIGFLTFTGVISIQLFAWYFQTGDFFVYSYQNEGFIYLSNPKFYEILFSYKKGLFIYTPFLLIASISVFLFLYKRNFYFFFSWIFFFTLLTYVLSSWHSWFYGCSYGLRAYIDYYVIFLIPFAIVVDKISLGIKIILVSFSLLTIPLNIIQTYQYKEYILHWIDMDKDKYWKVFLKTKDRYKGLVWKDDTFLGEKTIEKEISIGNFFIPKNRNRDIYTINSNEVPNFNKVNVIQVILDDEFKESDNSSITLRINDLNDSTYYWHQRYLIHFHETNLNEWQTGLFNYKFNPIVDNKNKIMTVELKSGNKDKEFRNIKLKFFNKE